MPAHQIFPELLPRPARSARAMALVLIAIGLLGRAVYCLTPVNSDTAMFVYAGKLVSNGGLPGIDLLDNKLPSVGLLMSVPYRLFGAHWWAYGVLGLAMSITASLMLARAARDTLGLSAGWVVGVAACVWLNFTPAVYGQLQLETITAFFAAIGGACALNLLRRCDLRDAFTIGLCAAMGAWAKPTGMAIVPAILITIAVLARWSWCDKCLSIFWILVGLSLPIAACGWIIAATGMATALPGTLAQLHDYASASTFDWVDALKPMLVTGLLMFPMLVLGAIFRRQVDDSCVTKKFVTFALLWFAAELAGVVAQRRMYAYHFLVLAPPASVLMAMIGRRLTATSLGMAFGPPAVIAAGWAVMLYASTSNSVRNPSRDDRVIAYLRNNAPAGVPVWMDDYPRLMVEGDFTPGSRVPLIFLFANSDAAPKQFGEALLHDFEARKPQHVVLWQDMDQVADLYAHHMAEVAGSPVRSAEIRTQLRAIDRYVRSAYDIEQTIDNRVIWRRRGDAQFRVADLKSERAE